LDNSTEGAPVITIELHKLIGKISKSLHVNTERATILKQKMNKDLELKNSPSRGLIHQDIQKDTSDIHKHLEQFRALQKLMIKVTKMGDSVKKSRDDILIEIKTFDKEDEEQIDEYERILAPNKQSEIENLYFYFVDSTFIYVYHPVTLKRTHKKKHRVGYIDAYTSKALMTSRGRFFVTGSLHRPKDFTYELSLEDLEFDDKQSMINGRCLHAFIELSPNYLIAVGGCYGFQALTECEYYDIEKDHWSPMSSLKKGRYYHVCLVFDGNILYAVGGKQNNYSSHFFIEKAELDNKFNGSWIQINMNSRYLDSPLNGQGLLRIGTFEYMIFGRDESKNEDAADCLVFSERNKTMTEVTYRMNMSDNFDGTSISYFYKDKFYVFSLNQNLHCFDGIKWKVRTNFVK